MNLSDSKKKLALAGVVCGLVAACLAVFRKSGKHGILYRLLYQRHGGRAGNASGRGRTVCQAGNYRPGSGGISDISSD